MSISRALPLLIILSSSLASFAAMAVTPEEEAAIKYKANQKKINALLRERAPDSYAEESFKQNNERAVVDLMKEMPVPKQFNQSDLDAYNQKNIENIKFLNDYEAYRKKRESFTSHPARFEGESTFKGAFCFNGQVVKRYNDVVTTSTTEAGTTSFYVRYELPPPVSASSTASTQSSQPASQGGDLSVVTEDPECGCVVGNRMLACLTKASASIYPAKRDYKGFATVLAFATDLIDGYAFIDGQWQPQGKFTRKKSTMTVNGLVAPIHFNVPIPQNAGAMCINKNFSLYVGYGVASDVDMQYAEKMLDVYPKFDIAEFAWVKARAEALKQKKYGLIAEAQCPAVFK